MCKEYTDEILIKCLRNSDEEAFVELYQRYWRRLYSSALKRISSEEDAKDIIQELFVKLWVRRASIPEEAIAGEYLFTSLRYRIINYIQADQVRVKYANSCLAEKGNLSVFPSVESNLALEELESVIQEAVENMPERMQEVFILSYRKGLSPKEISVQLSLSVQTVKNYLSNARMLLKGRMANQNNEFYAHMLLVLIYLSAS